MPGPRAEVQYRAELPLDILYHVSALSKRAIQRACIRRRGVSQQVEPRTYQEALDHPVRHLIPHIVDRPAPLPVFARGGAVLLQALCVPVEDLEGADGVGIDGGR